MIAEPDIVPQPDYVFKVNGKLDPATCPTARRIAAQAVAPAGETASQSP